MMKIVYLLFALLFSGLISAQRPCAFSTTVKDSLGTYRSTSEYLVHEKNFGGNSSYLFFSLAETDGLPTLNTQLIQKSSGFIKAQCFDKNSRIYLQLNNGKIVTLMHIDVENCGTSIRDQKGVNNRVMSGFFLFRKDSYEELKKSPVSLIRIKYSTETIDYIIKDELKSELDGKIYNPSGYFVETLHCLED
ncbi:MAG TPA: hypothetical protein VGB50_01380 [Flavobacterium sp.]|jgi:hypothetical protein